MNRKELLLAVLLAAAPAAAAALPRGELQDLTTALQKSPSDDALREKIIKFAATLKPFPAIPKEARRPFVMAGTFQKEAKSAGDYGAAIKAYDEALAVAPWWGDAYYNLSVALESANRFDEAKRALKLYLLTKPKDAEQAEDRLYALEAKESVAASAARDAAQDNAQKAKTMIVPGVGIGEARIGMNESEMKAVYGEPSKRVPFDNNNGYFGTFVTWGAEPETINVNFSHNQGAPFIGTQQRRHLTAEGVGTGSSVAEVTAAMGAPDKIRDFGYDNSALCYSRGVMFYYKTSGTKITSVTSIPAGSLKDWCPN